MMASLNFNPGKMLSKLIKANKETKRLNKQYPVTVSEAVLQQLEAKYKLDIEKLEQIGVIEKSANQSETAMTGAA
jgi:hypothetical protein